MDERLWRLAELISTAPLNLVSARERRSDRVLAGHVQEAALVSPMLPLEGGQRWMDLGTGGGLPGLVLAITNPDIAWVLVDSVEKKARAVAGFARELDVPNVEVVAGRSEYLGRDPRFRGAFDGVVARAVARLVTLVELARPFVHDGGLLGAVKGVTWGAEVEEARWALRRLAWGVARGRQVMGAVRPTWLVTTQARGPVPEGVPRGVGVASRRPLIAH